MPSYLCNTNELSAFRSQVILHIRVTCEKMHSSEIVCLKIFFRKLFYGTASVWRNKVTINNVHRVHMWKRFQDGRMMTVKMRAAENFAKM